MNQEELIQDILKGMEYDKSIRSGIWKNNNYAYQEFFHHAHGDMMPDDIRYVMIHDLLSNMDQYDDEYEMIDNLIPVYTSDLMAWISSHNTRYGYVDQYVESCGHADSVINDISGGYAEELHEVYNLIMEWINEHIEGDDEE